MSWFREDRNDSELLKWKMVRQYATEYAGKIIFVNHAERVLVFRVRKGHMYSFGETLYDRVRSEVISMIQEKSNEHFIEQARTDGEIDSTRKRQS